MKIKEELIEYNPVISIIEAKYIEEYVYKIKFSDGKTNEINFSDFLHKSKHPSIKNGVNIFGLL